jgi:hypothetical protein
MAGAASVLSFLRFHVLTVQADSDIEGSKKHNKAISGRKPLHIV